MKTIIFIGCYNSGSSREAIRAAERLGFYTVLFTDRKTFLEKRNEYPDIHEPILIDLEDLDAMRERIKYLQNQGKNIHAIVSFIDSLVFTAATLSDEFCGKRLSTEAIMKMEDKIKTRQTLLGTSFNVDYIVYEKGEDLPSVMSGSNLQYPVIVKSPYSTGSKDVLKAENEIELKKRITKLQRKYPSSPILLEEYIEAPQFLIEALVYNNEIHIIAIIEQEITPIKNRFIVTGYSLLAKVPPLLYESLSQTTKTIIEKFGMENGSCHLELRYHNQQWKLIEINPRISGGAMNKMIEAAYGINLAEQIIKVSLKEKPVLNKKFENFVFTQYITLSSEGILRKVTGKKSALSYHGVVDVYIKPKVGTYLHPPWSMGHRYAYVMAIGATKESATQIAKTAAKEIQFHLDQSKKEGI